MATVAEAPTFIRPDGLEKVTGAGRYTADVNLTGQLYAKFRYADHTHARILRVDASKARALPGVAIVLTHEDVPDVKYGGMVQDRRLFAKDKVRFEADILAGVAALTPEIAERAVGLIEVEYEPLPALTDPNAAISCSLSTISRPCATAPESSPLWTASTSATSSYATWLSKAITSSIRSSGTSAPKK